MNTVWVGLDKALHFIQVNWEFLRTRGSPVFKIARRAGQWYILVAWLENVIAPGRRASDFASPDKKLTEDFLVKDGGAKAHTDHHIITTDHN